MFTAQEGFLHGQLKLLPINLAHSSNVLVPIEAAMYGNSYHTVVVKKMHLTSFSFSMRTFFRATILFLSVLHLALKTSPKVPWPILAIFSYLLEKEHADTCETEIWYLIPVNKRKESTAAALIQRWSLYLYRDWEPISQNPDPASVMAKN
jgi:hypothetical protein